MGRYDNKVSEILTSTSCTQTKKAEVRQLNKETTAIKTACNIGMAVSAGIIPLDAVTGCACLTGITLMKKFLSE